ncbi:MAG TPA: aldehyde dehydrogenase family protein, partial [Phycisphaerales bacterium]|nr:aldehyde dehydrogenase family protein [Phycisphaerales bacterium]
MGSDTGRNGVAVQDISRSGLTSGGKGPGEIAGSWDYAPAPETVKVSIKPRYGHFIGGRWVAGKGGVFATVNPANEGVLSEVAQGSGADVDAAVKAARAALPAWSSLPGTERAKYIFRIARRIQERARELAILETMDSGKPIKE